MKHSAEIISLALLMSSAIAAGEDFRGRVVRIRLDLLTAFSSTLRIDHHKYDPWPARHPLISWLFRGCQHEIRRSSSTYRPSLDCSA
jgi:hypothetical protein